jgi:hypothetical protein
MVAIGMLVAWIPSAHAKPGLLIVGGGATEHDRSTVGGAIESAVRSEGWSLPAKPATKKEADGLLNCQDAQTPWTCVPSALSAKGIRDVIVVSVDASQAASGAPLVVITGRLIVTDPPAFAFFQRFCEHCADDKLTAAGAELARELIQDLAIRGGRTVVHFSSDPSTAEIILDGTKLGVTEATYDTYPGKHIAMVQKDGYTSEVREFTVESGKTADISFTLRPSVVVTTTTSTSAAQQPRSRLVPIALMASGGSLVLLGGVVLYRGQQTDSGRYRYTRGTSVGVTTGVIGLGAVAAGLYLFWRHADSGPTISVMPGGPAGSGSVGLGWSGSF